MKRTKLFLLSAVLIFAGTALAQGTKSAAAASVPEVQQAQPPSTIASTVDREVSTIEKQEQYSEWRLSGQCPPSCKAVRECS